MTVVSKNLAKHKIRDLMEDRGLTYQSLGDEIGVSPQAISEIVNGRTTGATARYALAAALGRRPENIWPDET